MTEEVEATEVVEAAAREFEARYRELKPRLFATALKMTRSSDQAEEVVAEAFYRAWRSFDRFRGEAAFGTWIHRILMNVVFDTAKRKREEEWEERSEKAEHHWEPEVHFEAAEIRIRIDSALGVLTPLQRQVFLMKEFEGMKHREIAEKLGIAEGTAKVHYFHALARLREELDDLR
ncbi:MAG: RNA polymerase sigma factor [Candidatus Hydrogenedentota bacterium]|nr:MAG: RNA polymerase sigma factor [Candidatus Hydrogenedentota bacterium]